MNSPTTKVRPIFMKLMAAAIVLYIIGNSCMVSELYVRFHKMEMLTINSSDQ